VRCSFTRNPTLDAGASAERTGYNLAARSHLAGSILDGVDESGQGGLDSYETHQGSIGKTTERYGAPKGQRASDQQFRVRRQTLGVAPFRAVPVHD
jgi:hypothetical protein